LKKISWEISIGQTLIKHWSSQEESFEHKSS